MAKNRKLKAKAKANKSAGAGKTSGGSAESSSRDVSDHEEEEQTMQEEEDDGLLDDASDPEDEVASSGPQRCKHVQHTNGIRKQIQAVASLLAACKSKASTASDKRGKKKAAADDDAEEPVCWVCAACGDNDCAQRPKHFVKKHEVAIELFSLRWRCFACKLDLDASNLTPNALEKVKQMSGQVERALGSSAKKASAASAVSARAASKAEAAEEAAAASAAAASSAYRPGDLASMSSTSAKGLRNLGNTCFFNSVLQCLAATTPLYGCLLFPSSQLYDSTAVSHAHPLQLALLNFLQSMAKSGPPPVVAEPAGKRHKGSKPDDSRVITPSGLLSAVSTLNPMFKGGRQHDSHELLRTILNGITMEKEDAERKKKQAIVQGIVREWSAERVLAWIDTWPLPLATRQLLATKLSSDAEHGWDGKFVLALIASFDAKPFKKARQLLMVAEKDHLRVIQRQLQRLKDGFLDLPAVAPSAEVEPSHESDDDDGAAEPLHPFESLLQSTFVNSVFGGVARNTVECLECHTLSVTHELFLDLSLAIEVPKIVAPRTFVPPPAKKFVQPAASASPKAVSKAACKGKMSKQARKALRRSARQGNKSATASEDEGEEELAEVKEEDEPAEETKTDETKGDSETAHVPDSTNEPAVAPVDSENAIPSSSDVPTAVDAAPDASAIPSAEDPLASSSEALVASILQDTVAELMEKLTLAPDLIDAAPTSVGEASTGAASDVAALPEDTSAGPIASSTAASLATPIDPVAVATTSSSPPSSSSTGVASPSAAALFLQYARAQRLGFDRLQATRPTIQDCLGAFTDPDLLTGSNRYGCKECSRRAQVAAATTAAAVAVAASIAIPPSPSPSPAAIAVATAVTAEPTTAASVAPATATTATASTSTPAPASSTSPDSSSEGAVAPAPESDPEPPQTADDSPAAALDAPTSDDTTVDAQGGEPSDAICESKPIAEAEPLPPPPPIWIKQDAIKRCQILVPPTVLTLHLKRFYATNRTLEKSSKTVDFPLCLNLGDYTTLPISASEVRPFSTGGTGARPADAWYHLYGLVSHGGGMGSGHYVSYARKTNVAAACENDGRASTHTGCECTQASSSDLTRDWHYFSDASTHPVTVGEVLKVQAYILFYVRV